MSEPVPENLGAAKDLYFDEPEVFAGLYEAMLFGAPNDPMDRATFFLPPAPDEEIVVDDEGVPLVITEEQTSTPVRIQVPCAIEYSTTPDATQTFGTLQPGQIVLTILGPDYDQIVGFEYVVIAGDRYNYRRSQPPVALGTIDVHTVLCQSPDVR